MRAAVTKDTALKIVKVSAPAASIATVAPLLSPSLEPTIFRVALLVGVGLYLGRLLVHVGLQRYLAFDQLRACAVVEALISTAWVMLIPFAVRSSPVVKVFIVLLLATFVAAEASVTGEVAQARGVELGCIRIRRVCVLGVSVEKLLTATPALWPCRIASHLNQQYGRYSKLVVVLVTALFPSMVVLEVSAAVKSEVSKSHSSGHAIRRKAPVKLPSPAPIMPPSADRDPDAPTYTEVCHAPGLQPGEGAPDWARNPLHAAFLGVRGPGALIAGCAGKVALLGAGNGMVALQPGSRDGRVVSIATADKRGNYGIILGESAVRIVLGLIERRSVVSVVARQSLGVGDGYVLRVNSDIALLLRGPVFRNGELQEYVYMDPAAARAWAAAVTSSQTLLWPRSSESLAHLRLVALPGDRHVGDIFIDDINNARVHMSNAEVLVPAHFPNFAEGNLMRLVGYKRSGRVE